ncbi:MAG: Hsp20/alpha crystallin family protein [Sphingomonadales bacterium]|nr:Hsp20/alpha crystallin family protein [Sphingomonadales bacterium]
MTDLVKTSSARTLSETGPMSWLRNEIDRLFEDFAQPRRSLFDFSSRATGLVPAMELVDQGKNYSLTAELPGLTDKDVSIELSDGVLTIEGEKSEQAEQKDGGCIMTERRYGSFRRRFSLPADANAEAIEARVKDGILTITIGKDEKAAPQAQKIAIQS